MICLPKLLKNQMTRTPFNHSSVKCLIKQMDGISLNWLTIHQLLSILRPIILLTSKLATIKSWSWRNLLESLKKLNQRLLSTKDYNNNLRVNLIQMMNPTINIQLKRIKRSPNQRQSNIQLKISYKLLNHLLSLF